MPDEQKALAALKLKAETDPALRAELMADPLTVIARETGIDPAKLSWPLEDEELMAVTGGRGGPPQPGKTKCSKCSEWIDDWLMAGHQFWHAMGG